MVKVTILVVLCVVILAVIIAVVGVQRTAAAVHEAGVGAFAAVGPTALATLLLQAAAWAALNRPIHHKVPFRTLFEASIVGQAGNILTPSTYLGGEPFKVLYVGQATGLPYHEVAGTVLLAKYLEGLSFVLCFGLATLVAAVSYEEVLFGPYLAVGVMLLVVAGALLALAAVMWLSLSRRWRPLARLVVMLARVPLFSRFFRPLVSRTRKMEDQVSRVFREEGATALVAFGVFALTHIVMFVRPAIFFWLGHRIGLGVRKLCLIFVVSQALLAFQLTPSGVGTLDGGLIGTFALVGLDQAHHAAQCMAYLLCIRFWDVLVVGAGVFLAGRVGTELLTAKPPATTELLEAEPSEDGQRMG